MSDFCLIMYADGNLCIMAYCMACMTFNCLHKAFVMCLKQVAYTSIMAVKLTH